MQRMVSMQVPAILCAVYGYARAHVLDSRDDLAPGHARRAARAAVRARWARDPRRDARVGHARAVTRGRSPAAGGARPAYDAGCGAEHFSDRSSGAAE